MIYAICGERLSVCFPDYGREKISICGIPISTNTIASAAAAVLCSDISEYHLLASWGYFPRYVPELAAKSRLMCQNFTC